MHVGVNAQGPSLHRFSTLSACGESMSKILAHTLCRSHGTHPHSVPAPPTLPIACLCPLACILALLLGQELLAAAVYGDLGVGRTRHVSEMGCVGRYTMEWNV